MNDLSTTVQSHYLESPGDQQKWFEIPGVLDIYPRQTYSALLTQVHSGERGLSLR